MTALMIVGLGVLLVGAVLLGIWVTGRKDKELGKSEAMKRSGGTSSARGVEGKR